VVDPEKIAAAADYEDPAETEDPSCRDSRRQPATLSQPARDRSLQGDEKVLLVNDNPEMRAVLATTLRDFGYHIWEASGAVEAQKVASVHEKIDLLLTDYSMPGSNGLELAMWFRALYPETKVLVASASLWSLGYQIGHQITFLPKPFTALELAKMVRRVLD
jgi:CheY-like chemotaxis protein